MSTGNAKTIKIGDQLVYRGFWGALPPATATVVGMTLTRQPRSKEGRNAEEVPYDLTASRPT